MGISSKELNRVGTGFQNRSPPLNQASLVRSSRRDAKMHFNCQQIHSPFEQHNVHDPNSISLAIQFSPLHYGWPNQSAAFHGCLRNLHKRIHFSLKTGQDRAMESQNN